MPGRMRRGSCCGMTGCSASDTQGEESAANSSTAANDAAATPATKELHAGSTTYFYAESMDPAADWNSWYLCYYGIAETLFKVSDDLDGRAVAGREH